MSCEPLLKIVKGLWFCLLIQFVLCCTSEFFVFLFTSELWVSYKSPTHTLQHTFSVFWSFSYCYRWMYVTGENIQVHACHLWHEQVLQVRAEEDGHNGEHPAQHWHRWFWWWRGHESPPHTLQLHTAGQSWVLCPYTPTSHSRSVVNPLPTRTPYCGSVKNPLPSCFN